MVSVIIPIFNVEKYLRQCLDSVVSQSYQDLEIILIDDGSSDGSSEICDIYQNSDSRIRVVHQENRGQAESRNRGLSLAGGEYVYFLDSDDVLDKEALEQLVGCIEREHADIVLFDADTLFEDFDDKNYFENLKRSRQYPTTQGAVMFMQLAENKEFLACPYLHLFKKSFLNRIQFCYPQLAMHEDELIMPITYIKAERISHLNQVLYTRRLRAGSVMSKQDSVLSVECIAACISGYIRELKQYSADSSESEALRMLIRIHAGTVMHKYALLEYEERMKASPIIKTVSRQVKELPYRDCRIAKLKLSHPTLFCLFRKLFLPVKKRFFD